MAISEMATNVIAIIVANRIEKLLAKRNDEKTDIEVDDTLDKMEKNIRIINEYISDMISCNDGSDKNLTNDDEVEWLDEEDDVYDEDNLIFRRVYKDFSSEEEVLKYQVIHNLILIKRNDEWYKITLENIAKFEDANQVIIIIYDNMVWRIHCYRYSDYDKYSKLREKYGRYEEQEIKILYRKGLYGKSMNEKLLLNVRIISDYEALKGYKKENFIKDCKDLIEVDNDINKQIVSFKKDNEKLKEIKNELEEYKNKIIFYKIKCKNSNMDSRVTTITSLAIFLLGAFKLLDKSDKPPIVYVLATLGLIFISLTLFVWLQLFNVNEMNVELLNRQLQIADKYLEKIEKL